MPDFTMNVFFTAETVDEAAELAEEISDHLLSHDQNWWGCGMVVSYNRNPIDSDLIAKEEDGVSP